MHYASQLPKDQGVFHMSSMIHTFIESLGCLCQLTPPFGHRWGYFYLTEVETLKVMNLTNYQPISSMLEKQVVMKEKKVKVRKKEQTKVLKMKQQKDLINSLTDITDFGPIMPLLLDEDVTEVMVNGPNQVYCERKGKVELSSVHLRDNGKVLSMIEKVVEKLGHRMDGNNPLVNVKLHDGSRFTAIIPPLSVTGPTLTIRKAAKKQLQLQDLIKLGTITEEVAVFLEECIRAGLNIFVTGGIGSGKTTTLRVLSKLVKNTFGMKREPIVIDEVFEGGTHEVLTAIKTCKQAVLAAGPSHCPRDMIIRLKTALLSEEAELPLETASKQVPVAIDVIIQQSRLIDGSRKITNITEVINLEGNEIILQDIFTFKQTGINKDGKIIGNLVRTGILPTFNNLLKV